MRRNVLSVAVLVVPFTSFIYHLCYSPRKEFFAVHRINRSCRLHLFLHNIIGLLLFCELEQNLVHYFSLKYKNLIKFQAYCPLVETGKLKNSKKILLSFPQTKKYSKLLRTSLVQLKNLVLKNLEDVQFDSKSIKILLHRVFNLIGNCPFWRQNCIFQATKTGLRSIATLLCFRMFIAISPPIRRTELLTIWLIRTKLNNWTMDCLP